MARAAPAYQRFEPGAAVLPQIAGLIEQLELVPLEGHAQVALGQRRCEAFASISGANRRNLLRPSSLAR